MRLFSPPEGRAASRFFSGGLYVQMIVVARGDFLTLLRRGSLRYNSLAFFADILAIEEIHEYSGEEFGAPFLFAPPALTPSRSAAELGECLQSDVHPKSLRTSHTLISRA